MKAITLVVPETRAGDILAAQTKKACEKQGFSLINVLRGHYKEQFMDQPVLIIEPSLEDKLALVFNSSLTADAVGEIKREIAGFKKIRQYFLNNPKENQEDYYVQEFGPGNWARKTTVDPDEFRRKTMGKVIFTTPVHLLDKNLVCLNYEKSERERIYRVSGSDKPYRKFNGDKNRHCGGCPFPDGCVVCTLP